MYVLFEKEKIDSILNYLLNSILPSKDVQEIAKLFVNAIQISEEQKNIINSTKESLE